MKAEDLFLALNELEDALIVDVCQNSCNRRSGKYQFTTVLVAAIIVSTLFLTAAASYDGTAWFRGFFSGLSGEVLTAAQQEYLDENTARLQQSVTSNGYTLTLDTAVTDGVRTYIRFLLTAPKDIVLDADRYTPENRDSLTLVNDQGQTFTSSSKWDTYDEDPTDNTVSILYTTDNSGISGTDDQIFQSTWKLRIIGLEARYWQEDTMEYTDEHLSDGLWDFTLQFPQQGGRVTEVITNPVPCPCQIHMGIQWNEDGRGEFILAEDSVEISSFRLRSLSADMVYHHADKDSINADFGEFVLGLKDGTQVTMHKYLCSPNYTTFYFDAPVILDEVSHILLPGGRMIPVPQTFSP